MISKEKFNESKLDKETLEQRVNGMYREHFDNGVIEESIEYFQDIIKDCGLSSVVFAQLLTQSIFSSKEDNFNRTASLISEILNRSLLTPDDIYLSIRFTIANSLPVLTDFPKLYFYYGHHLSEMLLKGLITIDILTIILKQDRNPDFDDEYENFGFKLMAETAKIFFKKTDNANDIKIDFLSISKNKKEEYFFTFGEKNPELKNFLPKF